MAAFKKVTEASLFNSDRSWSYRAILRFFYEQHERMREFLHPEDIWTHLKDREEVRDYSEEQLHSELQQLVKWNNLEARQEVGKVSRHCLGEST